jgi:putative membrane protein
MDLSFLPPVNAALNATAGMLLVRGRRLARAHRVDAHRRTMLTAFAVSSLFLLLYVVHKASRGFENTTFHATGTAKTAYLVLLASHVSLAMTVPPLAIALIALGLRGRIERHRRLARWAWPIWMYVSVTGVVIYVLLYPLNPVPARGGSRGAEGLGIPQRFQDIGQGGGDLRILREVATTPPHRTSVNGRGRQAPVAKRRSPRPRTWSDLRRVRRGGRRDAAPDDCSAGWTSTDRTRSTGLRMAGRAIPDGVPREVRVGGGLARRGPPRSGRR